MIGITRIIKRYPCTSFIFVLLLGIHIIDMFFIHIYPKNLEYRQLYLTASTWNFNIESVLISSLTHNDNFHLFRNLFLLSIGGPILETKVGSKNLFTIFIAGTITGICMFLLYSNINSIHTDVRGSSGGTFAVFGIAFSYLLYDRYKLRVGFSVVTSVVFISIAEFLKVTMNVEHLASTYRVMVAHISGLVVGYIVISVIYYIKDDNVDIGLYSFNMIYNIKNAMTKLNKLI